MDINDLLKNGELLILDGGMGSELDKRGHEMGGQNCLTEPAAVREVHSTYAASGCNFLITNTLTMNRIYLSSHGLTVDVKEVNEAGVTLAREAGGSRLGILGDMSSTGQMLEPYGTYTESQFTETFREQAGYLSGAGCDGFIVETVFDVREAVCAVKGCREVSDLPVFISISFTTTDNGGRTIMGNSAAEAVSALQNAGADAIGTNCGDLDPEGVAEIIMIMRPETDLPLIAQPNAGIPEMIENKAVYSLSPEDFMMGMKSCIENGANLIGGCCGTSPEHIKLLAEFVSER